MLPRRRASFELLSVSALDLFASALGVFMLLSLMMMPYFLKKPTVEAERAAERARLAQAEATLSEGERRAAAAAAARERAAAMQAQAAARLAQAGAAATAAEATRRDADAAASAAEEAARAAEQAAAPARRPVPQRRPGVVIDDLDLVIVMDVTGSMRDELADVQAGLVGILRILGRLSASLRAGFVAYKDVGDEFVTRSYPLSPVTAGRLPDLQAFVRSFRASGGGDDPEPVDRALAEALAMPWRSDAQALILVIGDAQAHLPGIGRALQMAEAFRQSAPSPAFPRRVTTVFTGKAGSPDEVFFERLARAGGGEFSRYQGQIIESVMMAVLKDPRAGGSR